MAEWRKLYGDISTSIRLAQVSDRAALLYTWGLAQLDDDGRAPGEPIWWKARVVPAREWTLADVAGCLAELVDAGLLDRYDGEIPDRIYVHSPTWRDRQPLRKDRYRPSDCPPPPKAPLSGNHVATERQPSGTLDQTRPEKTRPNQKKQKQKPPPRKKRADGDPRVKLLVDAFFEGQKTKNGSAPVAFPGGQAAQFFTRALQSEGVAEIQGHMNDFFETEDPFLRQAGWSFGTFVSRYDGLGGNNDNGWESYLPLIEDGEPHEIHFRTCLKEIPREFWPRLVTHFDKIQRRQYGYNAPGKGRLEKIADGFKSGV